MVDPFLKLKYGDILELDVHGLSLADARAEVLWALDSVDAGISGILVVHGFNKGTVIKNFFREKFSDQRVIKIIKPDAGATLLLLAEDVARIKSNHKKF